MIDFITANGGLLVVCIIAMLPLGIMVDVARHRRQAVDRLVDRIEHVEPITDQRAWRLTLKTEIQTRGMTNLLRQDAPGRVIARSVKRMTKETR